MRFPGIAFASVLLMAVLPQTALPQTATPPAGGPDTEVTIFKVPQRSYLTQGPVATPQNSSDLAANPVYQSSMPGDGIAGFQDYPLPRGFDLPGFGYQPD